MANPVGRPRTKLSDIPSDWDTIMRELAQQGASRVEIMAALGVSRPAYDTLLDDFPEFYATDSECKILCETWWEKQGRLMASGSSKDGNGVVWKFNMQNRFGWRDKADLNHGGQPGNPVQVIDPANLSDATITELLAARASATKPD